jgi:hypothetical protein
MENQVIVARFCTGTREFSLQSGSCVRLAFYIMNMWGEEGIFLRGKAEHSAHLVPSLRMPGAVPPFLLTRSLLVLG